MLTRSQAHKEANEGVGLDDSILASVLRDDTPLVSKECTLEAKPLKTAVEELPVSRQSLISAQHADRSLSKCFAEAVAMPKVKGKCRCESGDHVKMQGLGEPNNDWGFVHQIVVPSDFRKHVLVLAHDHPWSGHLGITKTYDRILKHFFWPGLKADVASYCRTCKTCQVSGKPNQVVPPAPLCPIPAVGEPFEHVIVDCVGPLPKAKSGNQFLLTIMCVATRFPEASTEDYCPNYNQSIDKVFHHLWPSKDLSNRQG